MKHIEYAGSDNEKKGKYRLSQGCESVNKTFPVFKSITSTVLSSEALASISPLEFHLTQLIEPGIL